MLVENLPVPFDRRVWMESTTLAAAGYQVSVICPRGRTRRLHEVIDGIHVYRYPLPSLPGLAGHAAEYVVALAATALLALVVQVRHGFDVIHAANPPDLFFLIAWGFRPFGKRFVFDHHDLVPETCLTRWSGRKGAFIHRLAVRWERATFRAASLVVSTNESYRRVAIERGKMAPGSVVVVRSGPLRSRFTPVAPDPALKAGRRFLACYLGVMGPNDGVEHVLAVAHELVHVRGFRDAGFVLIGGGDRHASLVEQAHALDLDGWVTFTGRIPDEDVIRYLSTADVGLAPDPKDALNDLSTMNKIVEYMAVGLPVLAFDLVEARVSARNAAAYARATDPADMARLLVELLQDPDRRHRMGEIGRRRFLEELAWDHQGPKLVRAYARLFGTARAEDARTEDA